MNLRPSGYEPDELPGCSTPRHLVLCVHLEREEGLRGPSLGHCCALCHCDGFLIGTPASMPGDVLLFQRLSVSTIGAVRFHGRVRDGIGWVTDAMVTKQWRRRAVFQSMLPVLLHLELISGWMIVRSSRPRCLLAGLSLMVGFIKHEQSY